MKVKCHSYQELEWKHTDAWMDGQMDESDCIISHIIRHHHSSHCNWSESAP